MEETPLDPDFRAMAQDLMRAGTGTGLPPRQHRSWIKTTVIGVLTMAVLGVAGGSFYYFQIYRPTIYARSILGLYDRAMAQGRAYNETTLKDGADYAGALEAIRKQRTLAERVKTELALLDPPPAMAGISQTFEQFLELNISAFADTEPKAEFFKTASDYRAEMKKFITIIQPEPQPTRPGQVRPPPTPTAGAVRAVWEATVPRMQSLGDALFKKKITGLDDPSYVELEAAWDKAGPGLPLLLAIVRKISALAAINSVPQNISPAELKRSEAAFSDISKFSDLIDKTLAKASAQDLLSFRTFSRQAELSERTFQLRQVIEDLRIRYGQ